MKETRLKLRVNTFFRDLQLPRFGDLDCFGGLVSRFLWHVFDFGDNVHPFENLAKDDVLPVKPANKLRKRREQE